MPYACLEGRVSPGDALALLAQSPAAIPLLTCSQGRAHSITPPIVFQETGYKGTVIKTVSRAGVGYYPLRLQVSSRELLRAWHC